MGSLRLPHGTPHNTEASVGVDGARVSLYVREAADNGNDVDARLSPGEARALMALLDEAANEAERRAGEPRLEIDYGKAGS